jgi:hypothetical protein
MWILNQNELKLKLNEFNSKHGVQTRYEELPCLEDCILIGFLKIDYFIKYDV